MTHLHCWHIKELAQLTKISVRTLHHYDQIGLLKPTHRGANGYRLYTESDIMRLQQILALKSLGFKLSLIAKIMNREMAPLDHFKAQKEMLDDKITSLMSIRQIIEDILTQGISQPVVSLDKVVYLIEEYHMSKELENSWEAKVLSQDELKQLIEMEANLKANYSLADKEAFEKKWAAIAQEVEQNLSHDPDSPLGRDIGKRCMDMVNPLYRPDQQELKNAIWEKGYRTGAVPMDQGGMRPEVAEWLDQAINCYYMHRIYNILNKIENHSPGQETVNAWKALLDELCGSSEKIRQEVNHTALEDPRIRQEAKDWLIKK